MKKKELLEYYITNQKINPLSAVMLTVLWWMNGELTDSDRDYILSLVGFSYNEETKTVSNGTEYTVFQLLKSCITDIYPNEIVLDCSLMEIFVEMAEYYGFITSAERSELVNTL
jgi:hypothetical protein